jgi:hypothetical protein
MNAEKICSKCHVSQPLSNFHNRKYVKDGKVSQCKSCIEKKRQKRLKDNPEKEAKRVKLVRERAQQRNRKFVYTYLQSHPCVDCGESRIQVLDFDHIKDNKQYNISYMTKSGFTIGKIKIEIAKCEVRCANCHRMKTATQFDWIKNINDQWDIYECIDSQEEYKNRFNKVLKLWKIGITKSEISKKLDIDLPTVGKYINYNT